METNVPYNKPDVNGSKFVRPYTLTVLFPLDIKDILDEISEKYHINSLANTAKILVRVAHKLHQSDHKLFMDLWSE